VQEAAVAGPGVAGQPEGAEAGREDALCQGGEQVPLEREAGQGGPGEDGGAQEGQPVVGEVEGGEALKVGELPGVQVGEQVVAGCQNSFGGL
jgi:hypothetical protein